MNYSDLCEEMITYTKKNSLKPNVLYYFVIENWERITNCFEDDNIVLEEIISFLSVKDAESRVKEVLNQNGLLCSSVYYTHSFGKAKRFAIPFSFTDMNNLPDSASECYFAFCIEA